ncbi:MAG: DUF6544 family protein [Halocynthiibacter sp.]
MIPLAVVFACIVLAVSAGLIALRVSDKRADCVEIERLLKTQPANPMAFHTDLIATLPEPAQRYFMFMIEEGTPLLPVVQLTMQGRFSLGSKENPNYMAMSAKQVLALPDGFVWGMSGGRGVMRISGSDSSRWTRFWLAGLVPVARAGGSWDHAASAYGRMVAEAVFWSPASVLPRDGVTWEALDDHTARVTVTHLSHVQAVDVTIDNTGRPTKVALNRWSNANPDGLYRQQSFGGYLSEFRIFEGYRIPTHVEGGYFIDTPAFHPFFIADVTKATFLTH